MPVKKHNVTISEPLSEIISTQIGSGRYKDFSSAIQDAAWNFFVGPPSALPSALEEYGLTAAEADQSHEKMSKDIEAARKAGKLKPWKAK